MAGDFGRFIFNNKLDNKEFINCLENEATTSKVEGGVN
jgi:hypothetical protein